jgi:hypothetical protein
VRRRRGACEVEDLVDLDVEAEGLRDIVLQDGETRVLHQVRDNVTASRIEVVDGEHLMPVREQPLAQVGTKESGATCDQHP